MTQLHVLLHARARIADGWCQHAEAKAASGRPVEAFDKAATQFCIFGAIVRECDHAEDSTMRACAVLKSLTTFLPESYSLVGDVVRYNDTEDRTVDEMIALLDKAIAHQLSMEGA